MQNFFTIYPVLFPVACGILGLLIGSFLNVVIYRLPVMLEKDWRMQCEEFLAEEENDPTVSEKTDERFDLLLPGSQCPHCQHKIKIWENIPVLSYVFLRGKCKSCKTNIAMRYPFVELLTATLSFLVAWHYGFSEQSAAALLLTWVLITLSFIDYDTQILPDVITLPMIWIGLLCSLGVVFVDAESSIIGAIAGYMVLWSVFQLFRLLTGKEGMGFGDFKLLSLLGAWLGWKLLPVIILLSSFAGAVIGVALMIFKQHSKDKPIPFGPYLAIAGWVAMIYGDAIIDGYFQISFA